MRLRPSWCWIQLLGAHLPDCGYLQRKDPELGERATSKTDVTCRHCPAEPVLGGTVPSRLSLWLMRMTRDKRPTIRTEVGCGVLAAPMFITAFTAIGANRPGYDWRRDPVSSLGIGEQGWPQRANFGLAGVLYLLAALGLRQCPRRSVGPRAVPALVAAAGVGLIGSGLFVTDPVGEFPPVVPGEDGAEGSIPPEPARTRAGRLHNLSAIPIFAGLPVAALASAFGAVRHGNVRWASYSACSGVGMVASFVAFGAAFGPGQLVTGRGGVFQRICVACGFGWITVLSLRALSALRRPESD